MMSNMGSLDLGHTVVWYQAPTHAETYLGHIELWYQYLKIAMDWLCNTVLPGLLTLHNSHVYFIPGVFIDGCVHTLGFGASIGSTLHSLVFFYSLLALFLFWRLYAGRSILHYRPFFISSWVTIQMLTGCIPLLCLWLAGVVPHLFSKRGYIWWHKCFNATMCVPAPLLALMHKSVESSQFDVSWGGPFFLAPGVLRLWKMRWRLVSWSPQTLHGALGGSPDLTTHCHWDKRLTLYFCRHCEQCVYVQPHL